VESQWPHVENFQSGSCGVICRCIKVWPLWCLLKVWLCLALPIEISPWSVCSQTWSLKLEGLPNMLKLTRLHPHILPFPLLLFQNGVTSPSLFHICFDCWLCSCVGLHSFPCSRGGFFIRDLPCTNPGVSKVRIDSILHRVSITPLGLLAAHILTKFVFGTRWGSLTLFG